MKQWYISKNARGGQKLTHSEQEARKHAGAAGGIRALRHNPSADDEGYAVVNGLGELVYFSSSENEAVEHAVQNTQGTGVVAMDDETAIPLEENPSLKGIQGKLAPTADRAYDLTGLPQVLQKLGYGRSLTRSDVEKWTLESAWNRIKHRLPSKQKEGSKSVISWQRSAKAAAGSLLAQNAKTAKGLSAAAGAVAEVYVSAGLSLAPHQLGFRGLVFDKQGRPEYADLEQKARQVTIMQKSPGGAVVDELKGNFTLCAGSSAQCRQTCLAYSGHNPLNDASYITKICLTEALYEEPAAFMRLLLEAIRKHFWKYGHKKVYEATVEGLQAGVETENVDDETNEELIEQELGLVENPPKTKAKIKKVNVPARYYPRVRLNVYQDIPWDVLCPDLLDIEWMNQRPEGIKGVEDPQRSKGIMYDYTKNLREPTEALDITFSCTGERTNMRACDEVLKADVNVAVVFVGASGEELEPAATGGKPLRKFSQKYTIAEKMLEVYPWSLQFVAGGKHWPVLNGDISDIRDQDPTGYVVGLTYKVPKVRYEVSDSVYKQRQEQYIKQFAAWEQRAKKAQAEGRAEPKPPEVASKYGYKSAVDARAVDQFVVRVRVFETEVSDLVTKKKSKIKALVTTHNPNQSHVLIS